MDPPEDLHSSSSLTRPRLTWVPVRGSLLVYVFSRFFGSEVHEILAPWRWMGTYMDATETDRWMPWIHIMYVYIYICV